MAIEALGLAALFLYAAAGTDGAEQQPAYGTNIVSVPEPSLQLARYLVYEPGSHVPRVALLPGGSAHQGAAPDYMVDLHEADGPAEELFVQGRPHPTYDGTGVRVAIIDSGVDFSSPDMRDAVARDKNNMPIMLDADGQGIVITNATFIADIDEHGILRTFEGEKPENITSTVYYDGTGVYLDIRQGGYGTILSVYNSLFPHNGLDIVFNGTVSQDMKIGEDSRNYLRSASGIYRLGLIYQGWADGKYEGLQVIPVLVTDPNAAGVYDTITPDMSTSYADYHSRGPSTAGYDYDFTDEKQIVIGNGDEFFTHDADGDGQDDYSAGMAGARVLDLYGAISGQADEDPYLGAVNGTLLEPMDANGTYFGMMTDSSDHGTSSAATLASRGVQEYDIYSNGTLYTITGTAPGASIVPVKAIWYGDIFYAGMWSAGFDRHADGWTYSGASRADIISNSWGVSQFPTGGYALGLDPVSLMYGAISLPRSLDPDYPGTVVVSSAGNTGHGYGTITSPAASPLSIAVGATTRSDFVGYSGFAGQPRYGNSTAHAGHIAGFSSRGPSVIGDPKPDVLGPGAYAFVPALVTVPRSYPGGQYEPFTVFGGTSMSTPAVAGIAASLIQALQDQGMRHDPALVKNILVSTASDAKNDALVQGAGSADAHSAIRFALAEPGSFVAYNDAMYPAAASVLGPAYARANHSEFGLGRLLVPESNMQQAPWFAGRLSPGQRAHATFTVENPSDEELHLQVRAEALAPAGRYSFNGTSVPRQPDPKIGGDAVFAPNYVRLQDVRGFESVSDYFSPAPAPQDAELMVLTARFGMDDFMQDDRKDRPTGKESFADRLQLVSLYLYDWIDDGDGQVSSDETALVNRAGSWGTGQEMRIAAPSGVFSGTPLVGAYPTPYKNSFWSGATPDHTTPINYTITAAYYEREDWGQAWVDDSQISVPPRSSAQFGATIAVPEDAGPGVYQGFISISGASQTAMIPASYAVSVPMAEGGAFAGRGSAGGPLYGPGHVGGAFNMADQYMAGDWRSFYFDVTDPQTNAAIVLLAWEDPGTSVGAFAVDPAGNIVSSTAPPGFGAVSSDSPSSDWLGTTAFSKGGGFYPVTTHNSTATAMYIPANQTGTWTVMAHATLYGGSQDSEPVSVSARFTSVP